MYPLLMLAVVFCFVLLRFGLNGKRMQEWLHGGVGTGVAQEQQPESGSRCFLPLLLQPSMLLFLVLFIDFVWSLCVLVANGLDPATFKRPPARNGTSAADLPQLMGTDWKVCLLGVVSLAALAVILTLLITALHLRRHVLEREDWQYGQLRWYPTLSHDLAMQIVLAPAVLGIIALDNEVLCLRVLTGAAYEEQNPEQHPGEEWGIWTNVTNSALDTYNLNRDVAGLYLAWALFCFSRIIFVLVRRQILKESPTIEYLISQVNQYLEQMQFQTRRDQETMSTLRLLGDPEKLLYQPLQQTLDLGVKVFVYTIFFKSLYNLLLAVAVESRGAPFPPRHLFLSPKQYVQGAAILASILAMLNIVFLVRKMRTILESFKPTAKALSVVALVFVEFVQQFKVQPGRTYSLIQVNLFYSCFICIGAMVLSMCVWCIWGPTEGDWYDGDINEFFHQGGYDHSHSFVGRSLSMPTGPHQGSRIMRRQSVLNLQADPAAPTEVPPVDMAGRWQDLYASYKEYAVSRQLRSIHNNQPSSFTLMLNPGLGVAEIKDVEALVAVLKQLAGDRAITVSYNLHQRARGSSL